MNSLVRVVAAFLVAPFGAFVGAWPSQVWLVLFAERDWRPVKYSLSDGESFALPAFIMSLIVGLPILFFLIKRKRVTAYSIVGTGVITAALPVILFGVGNMVYTALYFPDQLLGLPIADFTGILLMFSTVGAVCGLVFWAVAFWGNSAARKYAPETLSTRNAGSGGDKGFDSRNAKLK